MKTVSLTELKNNLSAIVAQVRKSRQPVLVCERDEPIVVIGLPVELSDKLLKDKMGRLERAEILVPVSGLALSPAEIKALRITPQKQVDLVKAILDEREEGP